MRDTHTDGTTAHSPYANILVPTDGSDLALEALEEALALAELSGGTIHVLYVVDDSTIAELATDTGLDDVSFDADVNRLFERFEGVGEHAIEDVREAAAARGADVVAEIRRGIPDEEILSYAADNDVDLVVMGTRGRRGVQRYLLGSTTERVLRRASVPVLAVREGCGDANGR
ncbi:MAG: universal stress protein [Haloferacaceae archaeon]